MALQGTGFSCKTTNKYSKNSHSRHLLPLIKTTYREYVAEPFHTFSLQFEIKNMQFDAIHNLTVWLAENRFYFSGYWFLNMLSKPALDK